MRDLLSLSQLTSNQLDRGLDRDVEFFDFAEANAGGQFGRAFQVQGREAVKQLAKGDRALDTRERVAGTDVDAKAEGKMPIWAPGDVEGLRRGELGRIVVAGTQHQVDDASRR